MTDTAPKPVDQPEWPEPTYRPSARELELGKVAPSSTTDERSAPPPEAAPTDIEPEGETVGPVTTAWRAFREGIDPRRASGGQPTRPLVLLALVSLFAGWDDAAFQIVLPEIRDEFGLDVAFFATLSVALDVVFRILKPLAGYVADRINRVRLTAYGNIAANLASVATGFAPGVGVMYLTRAGGGMAKSMGDAASLPLLTDWYPASARAKTFAFLGTAGLVGGIIGPIVGGGAAALIGWRAALIVLGSFATIVTFLLFGLKEPIRGRMDRIALGLDEDAEIEEPPPVSWSEGWRAAASIMTLRRLWWATPFLSAAGRGIGLLTAFYFADEFGVGPFGRGLLAAMWAAFGVIGLTMSGPFADRLLAYRPQRIITLYGGMVFLMGGVVIVLALSPVLWLSIVITIPFSIVGVMALPALGAVVSMVVPARMRAFGMSTTAPFELLGALITPLVLVLAGTANLRAALLTLLPIYWIGAAIFTSAAGGVARDIRAATAAAAAENVAGDGSDPDAPLLVVRDVDVTYDTAQVLFNVDLDIARGEIVALLGTNGAGKSTLLRAIAGTQQASNGAIFIDGRESTFRPPHEIAAAGVVFLPGGRAIFPGLTVSENLRSAAWLYRDQPEAVAARTAQVLEWFPKLAERANERAGSLSGGEQQMLALSQAFLMQPKLLMIDELSLGLAPKIVDQLLDIVREIRDGGTTIILVEQSINVAVTIAERALFMEKGQVRFDGPTHELLGRNDLVRAVFLGGAPSAGLRRRSKTAAQATEQRTVLSCRDIGLEYGGVTALDGVGFDIAAGEVLGIIGPNGAGKTSLFDVLSGHVTPSSGTVLLNGNPIGSLAPHDRAKLGLLRSYQQARLFPAMTVRETIAVALEQKLANRSTIAAAVWAPPSRNSERRASRRVDYLLELLELGAYADKFVSDLSTGSRRMVDLACILAAEPTALLLDEPSSGVAQAETEALAPLIRRMADDAGIAIALIEHDLPLVTSASDRVLAMELGRPIISGPPAEVVEHPRVIEAFIGASGVAANRSGVLSEALEVAGLTSHSSPSQETE